MSANEHAAVQPAALDAQDAGEQTAHEAIPRDPETTPSLSRYNVLKKLAVGGMAEIFIAQREGAEDICVIKLLHEHLSKDPIVSNRFLREAQVASLLDHKHIARLTDSKREAGLLYLAMEFIGGQDVESMMFKLMEQRKMLPPELSVTVTLDVLEGLHYAHDFRGPDGAHLEIVHRDLSPRNVMVTYTGDVKIIDFGLARTNLGDFRTAPGMVLGTLRYMSPEQAVAEPVDRRSDIYSWSVVLYEMLSGRPLVTGASAQEVLHAVVTQVPPPLSQLNPTLPKALDAVIERGLAKDRRDRWPTAKELREALIDAAGPLGAIDRARHDLIGQFVRELFPEEAAKTEILVEQARRGEVDDSPHEITRYADSHEQELASAQYMQTKLGSVTVGESDGAIIGLEVASLPYLAKSESTFPTALVHGPYVIDTATLPYGADATSMLPHPQRPPKSNLVMPLVAVTFAVLFGLLGVIVYSTTRNNAKVVEAKVAGGPIAEPTTAAPSAIAKPKPAARTTADDTLEIKSVQPDGPNAEPHESIAQRTVPKKKAVPAQSKTLAPVGGSEDEPAAATPPKTPPGPARRYAAIYKALRESEKYAKLHESEPNIAMPPALNAAEDDLIEARRVMGLSPVCTSRTNGKPLQRRIDILDECLRELEDAASKGTK